MAFETLLLEKHGGVGIITLNRPERLNALNDALTAEVDQALNQFEQDEEVKAIVVTGAGDRAFSAGGDIHEMSKQSEAQSNNKTSHSTDWGWNLAICKKPTIGAINGLAYGGGAVMATACDIRLGCERTSFRFLGVAYGRVNSTWTLPLIVGLPKAKELLFTGRVVGAEEALHIGLLNKLVPSSELMKAAVEMGQTIAGNNAATVQAIKEILIGNIGLSWREMRLKEVKFRAETFMPPPQESFRDFLERKAKK